MRTNRKTCQQERASYRVNRQVSATPGSSVRQSRVGFSLSRRAGAEASRLSPFTPVVPVLGEEDSVQDASLTHAPYVSDS